MRQSKKQKPFVNRMDRGFILLWKKADFDMGDIIIKLNYTSVNYN